MKKALLLTLISAFALNINAQQLFFEVFSGYNLTAYDAKDYNEQQGYVPIGARLAGGLEHVQLGVEYRQNITDAEFLILDETTGDEIRKDIFNESYYGGFIRANISSLPAYRFGLILKAGAGYYNTKREAFSLPTDAIDRLLSHEYDKTLGFNGGIGISAPIYTFLHWEIGYQFNYVQRDAVETLDFQIEKHNGFYHSFQMGLSMNLVFGNTAKRCRRVISSGPRR